MWCLPFIRNVRSCLLAGLLFAGVAGDTYRSVPPPADDTTFWCLPANPSCAPDRWATEWNETGTSELVQYDFIEPGLVSEDRLVEAIWLIWQWPDGKDLLRSAAEQGVVIVSAPLPLVVFAGYSPSRKQVVVNQAYAGGFTWLLGVVLVHELRHAVDVQTVDDEQETYEKCIEIERSAFEEETHYLAWIADRFSGLPKASDLIEGHLSPENVTLYNNLVEKRASGDLDALARETYEEECLVRPHVGS